MQDASISGVSAGYGDAVPSSLLGRLAGSLVMIGGLMMIALPITVIGNNFSSVYRESLAYREGEDLEDDSGDHVIRQRPQRPAG